MIKVSVIVPVYNVEKYLDKCLDSLVNQTLKDIEIIVVNDGSTDKSKQIIQSYKKEYPHLIKAITQTNKGIGYARNKGIKQSKGKYISFIDSDDFIAPDTLEKAYEHINKKQADIVVWNYYEVNEDGVIQSEKQLPKFDDANLKQMTSLIFSINPAPWNKLYKRTLFDNIKFPNDRIKYEDLMTIPKVLINANKISKLEKSYNYYLVRNNSETGTIDNRVFDILKVLENINDYTKDKLVFNEMYDEIAFLNIMHIMYQISNQKYSTNSHMSKKFIDKAYTFLNENFPNWKKNKYYVLNENFPSRVIKNNRLLVLFYCRLYQIILGGNKNEKN